MGWVKDGLGKGWGGWAFMPMHFHSFPHPPHRPPQPLPLFSVMISSLMEKMLSHISHFQCVGVPDSDTKIWTIKPLDSCCGCPRRRDLVLEEGRSTHRAWGRVLQSMALGRGMERGKGSFTLLYLGCKAFPLHLSPNSALSLISGASPKQEPQVFGCRWLCRYPGEQPGSCWPWCLFWSIITTQSSLPGERKLCCSSTAALPHGAAERAPSTSPGG